MVLRGWNHKDLGWDTTEKRWYYPIWPKLNSEFNRNDESSMRWKLEWKEVNISSDGEMDVE